MERHSKTVQYQEKNRAYGPLIVIVTVVFLASIVLQTRIQSWSFIVWMRDFMGLFMVIFSMVKLFDISGFADGFSMYDMVAHRFRIYGSIYPFLELFLGLAYLSGKGMLMACVVTLVVMSISTAGVVRSLIRGLDVHCACMGNILKVPLSTVSVVENIGMGGMALVMLIFELMR